MAVDGVPWFIGGDAEHGPDVARQLGYLASGGKEGVVAPTDLKVTALDVPGSGVKVAAGGASVLNRVASQQAYTVRNPVADTSSVQIAATGSGSGRSDLVVCRVDNPYVDGNAQAPADPVHGPYVSFAVIAGVPAGTTRLQDIPQYAGVSAITLARVDLPASTGTVTSSMITDLRALANPRSDRQIVAATPAEYYVTMATGQWKPFPQNAITGIQVPSWATHAVIRAETAMKYISGNAYANFRAFIGPAGAQLTANLFSTQTIDTTTGAGSYRQPFVMPSNGYFPIPASMRGTTVQISGVVQPVSSAGDGARIGTGAGDYYFADVTFVERIS